jgi:undecaprenyl-diphosphatase
MLLFDLTIHTGTVIAIFIVFRKSIAAFAKNLIAFGKYGSTPIAIYKKSPSVHLLVLAIVTTFVTSVLGLSFKHYFESARGSLAVIAVMWIINATLLLITDWRGKTRLGLRQFGLVAAVIVGLAQTAAIMPGISRSGATICAAILIGLHRRWAVEFSFLIAIPAILGATAVELIQNFDKINSAAMPLSTIIVGPAVAAIVGIAALKILIKVSRKANLKIFAFYCYILACFVFFFS